MEYKRYLNIFNSQSDYESQKDEVMDMPHVVLLEDTNEVIFASKNKEIDYASQPFTLVALEDGTMNIAMHYGATSMHYALNDGDWVEMTEAVSLTMNANDKVKIKVNGTSFNNGCASVFSPSMPFNAEGNIMSLLYGDDFQDKTSLEGMDNECFISLFKDTNIVSAKNLILPATTLANDCYYNMFNGCASLTTAPELPATTLANNCYQNMFYYCTSLTTAPQLLATTLAYSCYSYMFSNCTSLVEAPQLPATTLTNNCYNNMFSSCISLTTAPALHATTLAEWCYNGMFQGCSSLTTAPELPATKLANYCYGYMFYNCTSLVEAPQLPATTLASSCYSNMFYNCTSLTKAPELLATKLEYRCYDFMFYGCSKLNYIKMLATSISGTNYMDNWVKGVASSGTFVKSPNITSWKAGTIPQGWTIENA